MSSTLQTDIIWVRHLLRLSRNAYESDMRSQLVARISHLLPLIARLVSISGRCANLTTQWTRAKRARSLCSKLASHSENSYSYWKQQCPAGSFANLFVFVCECVCVCERARLGLIFRLPPSDEKARAARPHFIDFFLSNRCSMYCFDRRM